MGAGGEVGGDVGPKGVGVGFVVVGNLVVRIDDYIQAVGGGVVDGALHAGKLASAVGKVVPVGRLEGGRRGVSLDLPGVEENHTYRIETLGAH